jgi:hypothetical protein
METTGHFYRLMEKRRSMLLAITGRESRSKKSLFYRVVLIFGIVGGALFASIYLGVISFDGFEDGYSGVDASGEVEFAEEDGALAIQIISLRNAGVLYITRDSGEFAERPNGNAAVWDETDGLVGETIYVAGPTDEGSVTYVVHVETEGRGGTNKIGVHEVNE